MQRKIVLASGSPRRKKLLEQIGLKFEIRESEYEEDMTSHSDPYELCKFLALKKAQDVARHYEDAIIIAADTFAIIEGEIIGKPKSKEHASEILRRLSGKESEALTGFAIIDTKKNLITTDFSKGTLKFMNLSEEEISDYIKTGEPLEMAGAYGLMNKAAVLIESISGDFYSIIGLPLNKIYNELKKMGINVLKP